MSQRLNHLNEIISKLTTGADFYRKAGKQTRSSATAATFREQAQTHDAIAKELSGRVEEAGGEVRTFDAMEKGREFLGRIGAMLDGTDRMLVEALDRCEAAIIDSFAEALDDPDCDRDKAELEAGKAQIEAERHRLNETRERANAPSRARAVPPTPSPGPAPRVPKPTHG
ncbi:DUF2383 domain-containing protein [Histidinibacterium aquaticum]|uniref:DUF2383 domain-containing protein n=1 Tax=Histidinibacterium aquaticum TaxID=2613962 RepID=A0A5J5GN18_9RHOB|nr:DUF2383 domain-containing protein [Histidinibacterium aquaticum]KAA9009766.1 DUF2383 domain-containing protein [Histidinibacterium aquaticum]